MVVPVRHTRVRGLRMAHRERGADDPVVFLHGNPTSQTEVTVPGLHFLPEDSAPAIADALVAWLATPA